MRKLQIKIPSKIGPLYLVGSANGLYGIFWEKQPIPMLTKKDEAENVLLKKAATQLDEYFHGKRKKFELPLEPQGTDFQKKVWKELTKIPYGETRSYKEIAIAIKHPKAYRAVGTANGCNPLSVIVPCHRVIASDGSLGGYAGGLKIKKTLLELERNKRLPSLNENLARSKTR